MTSAEPSASGTTVPTVVVLLFVVAAGSVPVVYPAGPLVETPRYVLLWILVALTLVYLLLAARRVYREHGARATLKWLATGSLPRKKRGSGDRH